MLSKCACFALFAGVAAISIHSEPKVLRGAVKDHFGEPVPPEADAATIMRFAQVLSSRSKHRTVGESPVGDSIDTLFGYDAQEEEEELEEAAEGAELELSGGSRANVSAAADPSRTAPTPKENPKCDAACTNGSPEQREDCMLTCKQMQDEICHKGFSCVKGCGNNVKQLEKDHECQALCESVHAAVCYPFKFEASADDVSPHHDDKVPPSIEATPAPRIFKGLTMFCNLYPASFNFDVIVMTKPDDMKNGKPATSLGYKQCDEIELKTGDVIGLRAGGKDSGISKPIIKIPTVMLFGQWAHGNHQVNFNRYFAKSDGPFICNGFPIWEEDDINVGQELQLYRGGYGKAELAKLRYKECTASSLHKDDVLATTIKGEEAGAYTLTGSKTRVIVLGKAGETTALAYEAWTDKEFGGDSSGASSDKTKTEKLREVPDFNP